jgi:uncharacterized protein (DUF2126 family)
VRYRAWAPPSALHPTIDVQAPLTFDLVDSWRAARWAAANTTWRILAGATTAPFPVNAYEAEARRLARFFRVGHTPGTMTEPREERNPNFPFTLDCAGGPDR